MSLFSFGDLPTIQTRKALLLLDFQNDFVRPSGALHVPNTPDILDTLPQLAAAFRHAGDVVWVRSQYESPQSIIDWDFGDRVVLDKEPPRPKTVPSSTDVIEAASDRDSPEPVDEEAFLSADPSPCCGAQSTGFQFPAPILAAINAEQDTVLDKTGYSALESDGLVLSFRTRFVTELYLCGSLSNVSVYATALDAVRNGFSVTLIEDCLGFRDFQRHQEAMRRMADILGATGITAQELTQELDWDETDAIARRGAPPPKRSATPAGIESVMDELGVQGNEESIPGETSPDGEEPSLMGLANRSRVQHVAAAQSRVPIESKKIRARVRRPRRREPTPDPRAGSHADASENVPPTRPTESPGAVASARNSDGSIGEGDSRIVHDVNLPVDVFERIRSEVAWQKMYHLSGQVPRLVAVQVRSESDGTIPIYRHPADESPPPRPLTPVVNEVRVTVERILGHPLNHVLVQRYRDGQDRISEHSDKTLDIVRGSSICNVSLGAQRVMVLRTKTSASESGEGTEPGRTTQRVPLPHRSLFILGQKTNMRWLHGIRADKRPESAKSEEEQAYGGERISLTFRHIGTYIDPTANTIWGQGAVGKTADKARTVIHGDTGETEQLIHAFGQENRATEFDWDVVYGGGFDVVNFVSTTAARLVLSGDPVADLRVRLCLGENGLRYDLVADNKMANSEDGRLSKWPSYAEPEGTVVTGDLAILKHLADRKPSRPGVDVLWGGNHLLQIDDLLARWRDHHPPESESKTVHRFESGLDDWEQALEGQHYLGGSVLSVDDCSLWPVLREMVQTQGAFDARFANLTQYYHRVEKRGIVRTILDE